MRHLTYLAVLAACLAGTAPLELLLCTRVYRRPLRLILAVLPVAVPFVAWDLYAIHRHQWSYDLRRMSGVVLPGRLPLEELFFFFVIPACAILTLEAVHVVTGWTLGDEPGNGEP